MKKQWLIGIAVLLALSLASCNTAGQSVTPDTGLQSSQTENSEQQIEPSKTEDDFSSALMDKSTDDEEDPETEIGGGNSGLCMEHTFSYHAVTSELIDYVGKTEGHAWIDSAINASKDPYGRTGEDMTILAFIEEIQIPKETFTDLVRSNITDSFLDIVEMTREEYYEAFGYTDEQIDALYSGDQDQIDRAFCGPLAFANEADGQLYSIYWLAEHTAEDYAAAQLPLEQVEEVLQTAALEEYGARHDLIEQVEPALEQAYILEEQIAAANENAEEE